MNNHSIDQHTGGGRGSVKSYLTGLVLSILLTLLAFGAVAAGGGSLERMTILLIIGVCAVAQILVQLILFMHMGASSEWWNRTSLVFTVLTLAILVIGSLWVMYHLHENMHPGGLYDAIRESICALPGRGPV